MQIKKLKYILTVNHQEILYERPLPLGTIIKLGSGTILICYETGRIEIQGSKVQPTV